MRSFTQPVSLTLGRLRQVEQRQERVWCCTWPPTIQGEAVLARWIVSSLYGMLNYVGSREPSNRYHSYSLPFLAHVIAYASCLSIPNHVTKATRSLASHFVLRLVRLHHLGNWKRNLG
jgi:hypothetical protein